MNPFTLLQFIKFLRSKAIYVKREIFAVFIFAERDALATLLSADGHMRWRAEDTTLNDEANKQACATTVYSLLWGGLCNYESIKTAAAGKKLAC